MCDLQHSADSVEVLSVGITYRSWVEQQIIRTEKNIDIQGVSHRQRITGANVVVPSAQLKSNHFYGSASAR